MADINSMVCNHECHKKKGEESHLTCPECPNCVQCPLCNAYFKNCIPVEHINGCAGVPTTGMPGMAVVEENWDDKNDA